MATTPTAPPPVPPAPPASRMGMVFGVLKYLVPVAASVLSIFLHNRQTVKKVKQTADVLSGLDNAR